MHMSSFSLGNRVQIDATYWDKEVAGRTGRIEPYPRGATPQPGCVWVELDIEQQGPGVIDGVEVHPDSLALI